ncbi:MAG TPA: AAA family ATPase [Thermoplasmata archaeon]|nr:AAA family ATPase [Thermoplasmata archaeon]
MTGPTYDRYGLTGNPFRELASESLNDVELYHVNLEIDDALHSIEEEIFDRENRAIVAIVGEHGSGKTERLLLAATEAHQRNAFTVYFDVSAKVPWILRGLAQEFQKSATSAGLTRTFSSPSWLRGIAALEKLKDEKYDAISAGKAIGQALNETAPSLLLLNDLHNLIESREIHAFAKTLQQVSDVIKPGVLIMFNCFPSYMAWLTVNLPPFASRINRTIRLPGLTNNEAALLLAKKMLPKRLVEDLDPIYPFDRESVAALNETAGGNPRRLLELADLAIEFGVSHRLYRVDANVVRVVQPLRSPSKPGATPPSSPPASTQAYSEEPAPNATPITQSPATSSQVP